MDKTSKELQEYRLLKSKHKPIPLMPYPEDPEKKAREAEEERKREEQRKIEEEKKAQELLA